MKKDVQITVRLPSSLRDELRILSERDDRTLASYVALLLKKHVDQSFGRVQVDDKAARNRDEIK